MLLRLLKISKMKSTKAKKTKRLLNELLKVANWRYDRVINTSSNFKILGSKLSADWPKSKPYQKI